MISTTPPMDDDIVDLFEVWSSLAGEVGNNRNIRKWTKNLEEFEKEWNKKIDGGYWSHCPMSVTWTSDKKIGQGWGSCLTVGRQSPRNEQITVSLYFHCGKIVVNSAYKNGPEWDRILGLVTEISDKDDGLYHQLVLPDYTEDGFPLIDYDGALEQRKLYEENWDAIDMKRKKI